MAASSEGRGFMPMKRPQLISARSRRVRSSDVAAESPCVDPPCVDEDEPTVASPRPRRVRDFKKAVVWGVLPLLAFALAIAAGFFKWQNATMESSEVAGVRALQVAKEGTVAMLSYQPDTVEQNLTKARDFLTGGFRESYTSLVNDVVIPGAREQQISAEAKVAAAATVSAEADRAVVLVFVNQTTVIGDGPPSDLASTVRVTVEPVGDRWLISDFTPI